MVNPFAAGAYLIVSRRARYVGWLLRGRRPHWWPLQPLTWMSEYTDPQTGRIIRG